MKTLILASASPRRRELLQQAGAVFEVIPAKGEEHTTKDAPKDIVQELALKKAQEVAAAAPEGSLVLAADTVVAFDGKVLGKPKDPKDAAGMLTILSGNTHSVFTGVAVLDQEKNPVLNFYEETKVTMYPMSPEEIEAYVKTGEPMDKAGAYGIQGKCAIHIEKIQGDYNNVVGLPIAAIYQRLKKIGIEICGNS